MSYTVVQPHAVPYEKGRRVDEGWFCFTQTIELDPAPIEGLKKPIIGRTRTYSTQTCATAFMLESSMVATTAVDSKTKRIDHYQDSSIARRRDTRLSPYLSCLVAGLLLKVLPPSVYNVDIFPLAPLDRVRLEEKASSGCLYFVV